MKVTWIIRTAKAVMLGVGSLVAVGLFAGCPPVDERGPTQPAPQEEPVNPPQ